MSSCALVCPHLRLHATREQLQTRHQAQRPSVALILLQLPQMTALFSTTKPYIAHTGPATLARSWLIHHSRTYVCPPLLGQEAQILQLSPQNLKTRLCTVSLTPHSPLHTVNPSLVSTLCRILVCRSCCSLGRPGTFFKQLRHHLSDIAFPGLLKGFSPLRPTALCWNLSLGISPCLLIFHNTSWAPQGQDSRRPVSSAPMSFPDRALRN